MTNYSSGRGPASESPLVLELVDDLDVQIVLKANLAGKPRALVQVGSAARRFFSELAEFRPDRPQ